MAMLLAGGMRSGLFCIIGMGGVVLDQISVAFMLPSFLLYPPSHIDSEEAACVAADESCDSTVQSVGSGEEGGGGLAVGPGFVFPRPVKDARSMQHRMHRLRACMHALHSGEGGGERRRCLRSCPFLHNSTYHRPQRSSRPPIVVPPTWACATV